MGALELFNSTGSAFAKYEGEALVHDKLIGGIPKDADTIRKWLESRVTQGANLALQEVINETSDQMAEGAGFSELMDEVTKKLEGGNGFKSIDGQLMWEGRCLKAGLKEAANVAYPGIDWPGKPKGIKKGLMRFLAERVFVDDLYIPLGVSVPSGTEQRVKHIKDQRTGAPRSAIAVVDYVEQPKLAFTIAVLDDCIPQEVWSRIWQTLEEIGVGADRARSDGRFELLKWERIN